MSVHTGKVWALSLSYHRPEARSVSLLYFFLTFFLLTLLCHIYPYFFLSLFTQCQSPISHSPESILVVVIYTLA
jgi:hypothetical protein